MDAWLQSAGPPSSYTDAMKHIVALLACSAFSATAAAADPHSFAEPDKFLVRHVALDLAADFDARRLEGYGGTDRRAAGPERRRAGPRFEWPRDPRRAPHRGERPSRRCWPSSWASPTRSSAASSPSSSSIVARQPPRCGFASTTAPRTRRTPCSGSSRRRLPGRIPSCTPRVRPSWRGAGSRSRTARESASLTARASGRRPSWSP